MATLFISQSLLRAQTDVGNVGPPNENQNFDQTSTATPVSDPTTSNQFYANLYGGTSGSLLTSSTMTPPSGRTGTITFSQSGNGLYFQQYFSSQAAMDAAFGPGTYNVTVNTSTPNTYHYQPVLIADDLTSVPIPTITNTGWNGSGYLVVDSTHDITFTWNNSAGGNVGFTIFNSSVSQELSGSTTSYTVSANTLTANTTYQVNLQFNDATNSGYQRSTHFTIQTGTLGNDVGHYGMNKKIIYDQTSAAVPVVDSKIPYTFDCEIEPGTSGALFSNAALTPPANGTGTVSFTNSSQGLNFQESFASHAALDAAFPNGTYNLILQTTTPNNFSDQLTFASDNYPAIPQITGMTNATWSGGVMLVTDISQPVTINWINPSSLTYTNFNVNGNPGLSLQNNSGFGLNTFTIPANTLSNNTYFQGSIQSNNGTTNYNASTIPGASVGIDFQSEVDFTIQTGTPSSSSTTYNKVLKTHVLVQTSASGPVDSVGNSNDLTPGPYSLSITDTVAGTVTGPTSTSFPLTYTSGGGNNNDGDYEFASGAVATQSLLDTAYPDGSYTFPAPTQTVSLTGDNYPGVSSVTAVNGSAPVWDAQGHLVLDPTIQNIITWSSVTIPNFATNGFEMSQFREDNGNFQSIKQQAGATTSNAAFTTLTIGAGTMTAGSTYTGRIDYIALPSAPANPSPNVYFLGGYRTETEFSAIAKYPTGLLQAITFPAIANQIAGAAPFTISATATSGLPVTFTLVSGPATLSGTNNATVTLTGSGTVVIQASQAGNGVYAAAANTTRSFTIASQVITFPALNSQQVAGTSVTLNATASSGLPVTYQITGPASLSGANNNILTFTGTGTVTVEAEQAGNGSFGAATPVTQTVNVINPTDLSYFSIQKTVLYDQTVANSTALDLRKPYQFSSNIQGGNTGLVLSSSSLIPPVPSAGVVAYTDEGGGQSGLYFSEGFTTQSALDDAAFDTGTYNFTIQTSTPNTYTSPLNLGAANYPAVPQIISVTYGPNNTAAVWSNGLVVIPDNTQSITVTWNNPSGTNDGYFQINNTSVNSNSAPVSNTFTISANALSNNSVYQGSIILTNGNGSSSSIPGVNSQASYQTQVNFYLQVGTPGVSSTGLYFLQKNHVLVQSSNSAPVDGAGDINNFDPAPYDLRIQSPVSGTTSGPGSTSFPLTLNGGGTKYRYNSAAFASQNALNSADPDGTYTFPGSGGVVNLSGTGAGNGYPAATQIISVNNATPVWDAQGQLVLDPTVLNTIAWSSVNVNLATNGYESAELSDSNGNTLTQLQAGVTQSSTTAFSQLSIPANTMTATQTYVGDINYTQSSTFNTLVAGTTYAGAGYETETYFTAVALKPQTITFGPIAPQLLSEGTYTLDATASSGLPITYNLVSGPATLNGNILTLTGTGTVTVTANQIGNGTYASVPGLTQSFAVSGAAPLDFHDWEAQYFNMAQMADSTTSGPAATPEHDGVTNLLKYLFDIDPAQPMPASDRAGLPVEDAVTISGAQYVTLTFRDYLLKEGIGIAVQSSTDLKTWSVDTNPNDQPQPTGFTDGTTGDPYDVVKVPISGTREFIRLQVTQP